MARFWFCVAPNQPTFGTNSVGVIWLEQCRVVVRTERQLVTTSGKMVDSHTESDPNAEAFAEEFSEKYPQISKLYPSMRALENLFRFQALFSAALYQGVLQNSGVAFLRDNYPLQAAQDMPESLPGLANGRLVRWSTPSAQGRVAQYTLAPVISGGVDLGVKVDSRTMSAIIPKRSEICGAAIRMRPAASSIMWTFEM